MPTTTPSAVTLAEPTSTGEATAKAPIPPPKDVAATLAWMQERTLRCEERPGPGDARRWDCTGVTSWDSSHFDVDTVTIERNPDGSSTYVGVLDATQTVGLEACPGLVCDPYTGFFGDTIALAPITGLDGPVLGHWIDTHAKTAWRQQFGALVATYRPTMPLMTITITIEPTT